MAEIYTDQDAAEAILGATWDQETAEALVALHAARAQLLVAEERLRAVLAKPFPVPPIDLGVASRQLASMALTPEWIG